MRVVLDTNVVVSAILFGGKPRQILEAALAGHFRICLSDPMAAELHGVLGRPKFGFRGQIVQNIVSELSSLAEWVTPQHHSHLVKDDPDDNHVIDCAIEADADYLVSGDRHLLKIGTCGKTQILTPDSFIATLQKSRS